MDPHARAPAGGRPRPPRAAPARRFAASWPTSRPSRAPTRTRCCGSSASACRRRCASSPTRSARRSSSRTTAGSRQSELAETARPAAGYDQEPDVRGLVAHARAARRTGDGGLIGPPRPDRRLRARRARRRTRPRPTSGISGQCEECREQLAELNGAAASLAFGAVAPAPPARLRASILEAAAAERTNVVPLLRRRWVSRGLAVAAAAVACVAVGLGVSLQPVEPHDDGHRRSSSARTGRRRCTSPACCTLRPGRRTRRGSSRPETASTARRPLPRGASSVPSTARVPKHAVVAVTIEPAGGSTQPTTTPIFTAPA